MVISAPKPRPVVSGFWTFCDQTGDLRHVDAHAESTVCTRWPLLDRWHRYLIERGVDWLLNAAGAGRERLDAALRVPYPGSRLDRLSPIQSAFWHRLLHGLSGGAQVSLYLGDGEAGSLGGLVVDDAKDETSVAGWTGGRSQPSRVANPGTGPGRGTGGASSAGGGSKGGGGGGGGYATAGANGGQGSGPGKGGQAVPAGWVFQAILSNAYTKENLGLGGGGGKGGWGQGGDGGGNGGSSGQARLRFSTLDLTETLDRSQSGNAGSNGGDRPDGGGGGGSGGLYLALAARGFTLSATITCRQGNGGRAGSSSTAHGGAGGQGRVIVCYGDSVDTSAGTINNASLTTYQLLPSLPLGQVQVS